MARADRRRDARAKPVAAGAERYQSAYVGTEQLFFQRLRKQAKWVFVFLAFVFAFTFVVFGVGSEVPGGVADIVQGGGGGGPDVAVRAGAHAGESGRGRRVARPRDRAAAGRPAGGGDRAARALRRPRAEGHGRARHAREPLPDQGRQPRRPASRGAAAGGARQPRPVVHASVRLAVRAGVRDEPGHRRARRRLERPGQRPVHAHDAGLPAGEAQVRATRRAAARGRQHPDPARPGG